MKGNWRVRKVVAKLLKAEREANKGAGRLYYYKVSTASGKVSWGAALGRGMTHAALVAVSGNGDSGLPFINLFKSYTLDCGVVHYGGRKPYPRERGMNRASTAQRYILFDGTVLDIWDEATEMRRLAWQRVIAE